MARSPWWRIGWRNLGRNRRRTLFTTSGLAVGYCAVVAMAGLSRGMIAEMVDNGTRLVSGQLQVHADEYLPERSLHETIGGREGADVPALIEALVADPAVSAAAPRVFGGGLVSSGEATVAAQFIGVDPDLEPAVTSILASLEGGRIPRSGANELLVGVEMARQLALREGDTVVVVAPAADGSLGNDLFRVHEIAARIDDPWVAPMAADRLAPAARTVEATAEVTPWTTFRPEMVDYAAIAIAAEWIVLVIIYAIAIFGVANTMLMATYERRFEFALLLALGSTPGVVVRSVLAEALVLGAASLALGVLITFPLMIWWHVAPPDMSWLYGGTTMAGGLMRPVLRVEYPVALAIGAGAALFGTTVLAALFPAWRSSRILPADTLAGR
jgi:ABC-type lipoprotein release transport system permease subunit